eukprot:scaffold104262_cov41-Prasinocladus_malaysianus.AAC.1
MPLSCLSVPTAELTAQNLAFEPDISIVRDCVCASPGRTLTSYSAWRGPEGQRYSLACRGFSVRSVFRPRGPHERSTPALGLLQCSPRTHAMWNATAPSSMAP